MLNRLTFLFDNILYFILKLQVNDRPPSVMVKLTAVHYGLDDASFSKSLKKQITAKESGKQDKEKNTEKADSNQISGGAKKGEKRKATTVCVMDKRPKRAKTGNEFTCNNCGELFKTEHKFKQHKSQDSCLE